MKLFTSIEPNEKRLEMQLLCISSWQELGFEVISVNNEKEFMKLQHEFKHVKFQLVDDDNQIAFDTLLKVFKETKDEVMGYCNSDIYLEGHGLRNFIEREVKNSMIFTQRYDVQSIAERPGVKVGGGFDTFWFCRDLVVPTYSPSTYRIGKPGWDDWFITVPLIAGVQVKNLMTPVAYHVAHKVRWSKREASEYGRNLDNLGIPYRDAEFIIKANAIKIYM